MNSSDCLPDEETRNQYLQALMLAGRKARYEGENIVVRNSADIIVQEAHIFTPSSNDPNECDYCHGPKGNTERFKNANHPNL